MQLYEFKFLQQIVDPETKLTKDYHQFVCYARTHHEAFQKWCHSSVIQDKNMNQLGELTVNVSPSDR